MSSDKLDEKSIDYVLGQIQVKQEHISKTLEDLVRDVEALKRFKIAAIAIACGAGGIGSVLSEFGKALFQ